MKKTQTEIKAIAAQLEAIRADQLQPDQTSLQQAPVSAKAFTADRNPQPVNSVLPPQITESQTPTVTPTSATLLLTVESLRQRSLPYLQQSQPLPQPQPAADRTENQSNVEQTLASQVQRVNQLAAQQEAAVLELKAIFEQVGQVRSRLVHPGKASPQLPPLHSLNREAVCDYQAVAVPYVEKTEQGSWIMRTRSVDLFKAEREAALIAEALRYRTYRSSTSRPPDALSQITPPLGQWSKSLLSFWLKAFRSTSRAAKHPASKKPKTSRSTQPQAAFPSVQESLMLVIAATLARLSMEWVVQVYPMLWLPTIAVMLFPAAVAVYRSTITPQSGFLWGCRLSLLMLGLLLGGRL
ncbi:MAG TPA: hypothetical protein V6D10_20275 [Trichocoleus sp.]|jgi:hypothetical protein